MLETVMSMLPWLFSFCRNVSTPWPRTNFSVTCSPVFCALAPFGIAFMAVAITPGITNERRGLTTKLRYWLARRICRRYARDYL